MAGHPSGKPLSVGAITEAPICQTLADLYNNDSRRTMGRLLRQFLDKNRLTALELMFDRAQLLALEREDVLYSAAIQKVAALQAKSRGGEATDRMEALSRLIAQARGHAQQGGAHPENIELLRDKGLPVFLKERAALDAETRALQIWGSLAALSAAEADWDSKARVFLTMLKSCDGKASRSFLDGCLAELLDSAHALGEIIGHQESHGEMLCSMAMVARGLYKVPSHSTTCLKLLVETFAKQDLPLARAALFNRIANVLQGTAKLQADAGDDGQQAFMALLEALTERAGLAGGAGLTEAIAKRTQTLFGENEDLDAHQVMDVIIVNLPSRAAKLGFLLDLSQTDFGKRHQDILLNALGRVLKQVSTVNKLCPKGTSFEELNAAIAELKERLRNSGLPQEMLETLGRMLNGEDKALPDSAGDKTVKRAKAKVDRTQIRPGEVIFEQGSVGDRAYIIASGSVEIVRQGKRGTKQVASLGRGEVFGEMALIDHDVRMATARALSPVDLMVITGDDLNKRLDRLEKSDLVLRRLIDVYVKRLRDMAGAGED